MKTFYFILSIFVIFFISINFGLSNWEKTARLNGESITKIAESPDGSVYACSQYGYIYKSYDKGENWEVAYYQSGKKIYDICFDTERYVYANINYGILLSGSYGEQWKEWKVNYSTGTSLFIDSSGNLFSIYNNYFAKSSNGGSQWDTSGNFGYIYSISKILLNKNGDLFVAGDDKKIFIKKRNSDNWIYSIPDSNFEYVTTMSFDNDGNLYAAYEKTNWVSNVGYIIGKLFKSTDYGLTWDSIGMENKFSNVEIVFDKNNNIYMATGKGLFIGKIENNTFIETASVKGDYFTSVCVLSDGTILAATSGSGIIKSTDSGQTWNLKNQDMAKIEIKSIAVNSKNDKYVSAYRVGIFRLANGSNEWEKVTSNLPTKFVNKLAIKDDIIFAGTFGDGVFKSTDYGQSWVSVWDSILNYRFKNFSSRVINFIEFNSKGDIFAGTNSGLFVSSDNGVYWTSIDPFNYIIYGLGIVDTVIYACLSNSQEIMNYKLNGLDSKWDLINDLYNKNNPIRIKTFEHNKEGVIFAVSNSRLPNTCLWRSMDKGYSWQDSYSNTSLGFKSIYAIKNVHRDLGNDVLYVGTDYNIYRTYDNGDTWEDFSYGLDSNTVVSLEVDSTGILYACTASNGVYRTTKPMGINKHESNFVNVNLYPNPAYSGETVRIAHNFINSGYVSSIIITNLLGEKQNIPIIQTNSGYAEFSTAGLAPGVYFVLINSADGVKSSRFAVIK